MAPDEGTPEPAPGGDAPGPDGDGAPHLHTDTADPTGHLPDSGHTGADPGSILGEGEEAISVEAILDDFEQVTAERDAFLADLQRVTAEFANFRKQTERRNTDLVAHAAARLAEALLPVLDACDAAVAQGVDGVDAVRGQLLGVLEREGLEVVAEVGTRFDPEVHEAVMSEPGEGADEGPVVADVLRAGYAWKGRTLRPAMVKVRG